MSAEMRTKKLRGSGGYVMASISDEQQMKGNLGGPDLFLAPMGRLDEERISKHFCNTCEKEFEGAPKIRYESPNEEVADNLILAEKGQYLCGSCDGTLAEYREFKKMDEAGEIGHAKPLEPAAAPEAPAAEPAVQEQAAAGPGGGGAAPEPAAEQAEEASGRRPAEAAEAAAGSVSPIGGRIVFDEDANQIGKSKHVGLDPSQSLVLVVTRNDGTEEAVSWDRIKKIGEVILLGDPAQASPEKPPGECQGCGFANNEGSKFCEECGARL